MYHFKIYGNNQLLSRPKIAIHASRETPARLSLPAQKLFKILLKLGLAIGGGWHSPLEKQLLELYQPAAQTDLLIFIAKKFANYRLPIHLKWAYDREKIAIVEPAIEQVRISRITVGLRDRLIDDLIDRHLFLYIHPDGKLAKRFQKMRERQKIIYVMDHPENREFIVPGVRLIDNETASDILAN